MTRWLVLAAGAALLGASHSDDEVTYRQHIAPIMARRCLPCHNAGEAGAFPLTSYSEVRRRASLIRWVVLAGNMPPTKIDSDLHPITSGNLADEERIAIQEWVRTGMKEGHSTLPGPVKEVAWRMPSPDTLAKPTESVTVSAEGIPYRRVFLIDPQIQEPKNLTAFDVRPASPFVVRHAWAAVIKKDGGAYGETKVFRREGLDASKMIGAWAPGYPYWQSESGVTLEPGDRIAVGVLYQPTGRSESAGFELGLRWKRAGAPATWHTLGRAEGTIKPGDGVQTFTDELIIESDRKLRGFIPECRDYARQVRLLAILPGKPTETLLRINTWDVNWIGAYQWAKPIELPAGTTLRVEIDYDNSGHSAGNRETQPINPVKFGAHEGEELFWAHLQFD